MDAASILALAVDEVSDQQEEEVGHAPVEGRGPGRPPRRLCRRVLKKPKLGAKQLQAQSLTHNNAGAATRSDSLLAVGATAPRGVNVPIWELSRVLENKARVFLARAGKGGRQKQYSKLSLTM